MLTFWVPPLSKASPSGQDIGWGFQFLPLRMVETGKCFKKLYNLRGKNVADFENWKCGCFLQRKWKVGEGARFCFCPLVLTRAVLKSRRTICHEAQESQTVPCHANASWHIFFFFILIFFCILIIINFSNLSKDFSTPRCHVFCCPPEKGIHLWKYFFCPRRPLDGEKFLPLVHSAVLASSLGGSLASWHFWSPGLLLSTYTLCGDGISGGQWAGLAHPGQHDRGVMAHTLDPRPFQLAIALLNLKLKALAISNH